VVGEAQQQRRPRPDGIDHVEIRVSVRQVVAVAPVNFAESAAHAGTILCWPASVSHQLPAGSPVHKAAFAEPAGDDIQTWPGELRKIAGTPRPWMEEHFK
jgi:hypothetical protein